MDEATLFCVFPYLELSEPVWIRGELLIPTSALDNSKISDSQKEHIGKLQEYFFWYRGGKISSLTWSILPTHSSRRRRHEFENHLEEIRKILGYLCCIPDDRPQWFWINRNYEQVDYFVFEPETRIRREFINCVTYDEYPGQGKNNEEYVDGYRHSVNQGERWSIAEGCRIYPRSRTVSHPFQLTNLLRRVGRQHQSVSILSLFEKDNLDDKQVKRIFTAIEWYNRSFGANITTDLSLVCLAVAFETLLGMRRDQDSGSDSISQKMLASIRLLVGDVSRLADWFDQFYNARSRILHEGEWSQLRFLLPEEKAKSTQVSNEYGHLAHYGWMIFRICLNAILAGWLKASDYDLKSKFFHHQERLERMLETLFIENDPYDALIAVIGDIETLFRYPSEDPQYVKLNTVWEVGVKLSEKLLSIDIDLTESQKTLLHEIISDIQPSQFKDSEDIIQHTLLVFQNTNELPFEKVINPAIKYLSAQPPPAILDIKVHIDEILNDDRNKHISINLRTRLQNIVALIDYSFYREKLELIPDMASSWGSSFISRESLFSLLEGYSSFARRVVESNELNTSLYIHSYRHHNE